MSVQVAVVGSLCVSNHHRWDSEVLCYYLAVICWIDSIASLAVSEPGAA